MFPPRTRKSPLIIVSWSRFELLKHFLLKEITAFVKLLCDSKDSKII